MEEVCDKNLLKLPKKLIVCCDGTWMDSDTCSSTPSNVTRIARAIKNEDQHASPQIVYYQAGVGTGLGLRDQLLGGGTGLGLDDHIREAYVFLANNYQTGDLIYLVGFSRGAFTARSLAGMIGQLGLLNKTGLEYFGLIFEDWEHAGVASYDGPQFFRQYRDEATHKKYELKTPGNVRELAVKYMRDYRAMLRMLGLTHQAPEGKNHEQQEIKIQAVACWDTVGALGIPINPTFQRWFHLPAFFQVQRLKWMDTTLGDNVCNAFQALALDEHRAPFSPAVWEKPPGSTTNLKQVWFPGTHSGVGGGYDDTAMADITLAWMMDQLSGCSAASEEDRNPQNWIEFHEEYLNRAYSQNCEWYRKNLPVRSWGTGSITKSLNFPESIAGAITRTPGRYHATDGKTRANRGDLLRDTHEYIHASVRARIDLGGLAPEDDPRHWNLWTKIVGLVHLILGRNGQQLYRPASLKPWKLIDGHRRHDSFSINNVDLESAKTTPYWIWQGNDAGLGAELRLDEDKLGKFELKLLSHFDEVAEKIARSNSGRESIESVKGLVKDELNARRSATI